MFLFGAPTALTVDRLDGSTKGLKAPESSRNLWIKKVPVFKALRTCIPVLFY
jgi:hypothetical protein